MCFFHACVHAAIWRLWLQKRIWSGKVVNDSFSQRLVTAIFMTFDAQEKGSKFDPRCCWQPAQVMVAGPESKTLEA